MSKSTIDRNWHFVNDETPVGVLCTASEPLYITDNLSRVTCSDCQELVVVARPQGLKLAISDALQGLSVRRIRLELAAGIYKEGRADLDVDHGFCFCASSSEDLEMLQRAEQRLVRHLEDAKKELAMFRRGRGLRIALDQLLPGWFDIDLEDHLYGEVAYSFVSNSPEEWFTWLISQEISREDAIELIARDGPRPPRNAGE